MEYMPMVFFILAVLVFLIVFWIDEVWRVVTTRDEDFPGRNDKLMWANIVFFGFIVGAIIFRVWRSEYQRVRSGEENN